MVQIGVDAVVGDTMLKHSKSEFKERGRDGGFSLIELLIVVAIILVIAAIAIPNFLRARMAANEAAAVENCRTITSAQVIYYTTYGIGFAASLATLTGPGGAPPTPTAANLIDPILATGTKAGYTFTYVPATPDSNGYFQDYALNADPVASDITGVRHFFTNEPAVIRWNLSVVASLTDPPLQ
jgi:type IV pilus assembly protein PilA